jgi:hypothetical protein
MTSTAGRSPRLKSHTPTTDRPSPAEPAPVTAAGSAPKVAAEGVPSVLRPDPHPRPGREPIAWLHVAAPDRRTPPRGESWCACGRHVTAVGRDDVAALIETHTEHRAVCRLRHPETERSRAA